MTWIIRGGKILNHSFPRAGTCQVELFWGLWESSSDLSSQACDPGPHPGPCLQEPAGVMPPRMPSTGVLGTSAPQPPSRCCAAAPAVN